MAGLFAILVVMGTASLEAREASPLPAEALPMAPRLVAGWALDDRAPAWQRDSAHDTRSMELSYSREGRALRVVIIAALWREAKLQESRLAPREEGVWRQKELREDSGCVGTQCIALRHAIWQRDKGRELRHVYSAYSIGRLVTDSRLALRAMQGWHRLTGDAVRPRLVAIAGADILNANDAAAMILAIVRP
jgi:hypothetical protein